MKWEFTEVNNLTPHELEIDWTSNDFTVPYPNIELVRCVVKTVRTKEYFPVIYETMDVTLLAHRNAFLDIDWTGGITATLDEKEYTYETTAIGYQDSGDYE